MGQKIRVTRQRSGCDDAHCDRTYDTDQPDMVLVQGTVMAAGDVEGVEGIPAHEGLLLVSRSVLRDANL